MKRLAFSAFLALVIVMFIVSIILIGIDISIDSTGGGGFIQVGDPIQVIDAPSEYPNQTCLVAVQNGTIYGVYSCDDEEYSYPTYRWSLNWVAVVQPEGDCYQLLSYGTPLATYCFGS